MLKGQLTAFFLILLFNTLGKAQDQATQVIRSLNEVIKPIETIRPDTSFSDLQFLKQSLTCRDIVALGEGTHATKEFFLYKDRLIRFLVTELGYKAIGFESDFSAVQKLDDYINGKVETMARGYGGFPLTEETKAMLSWLRSYNESRVVQDRVHLYGLEARGFGNICASILSSLNNLPPAYQVLLKSIQETSYQTLKKKDIAEVKAIIPTLSQLAEKDGNVFNKHYVTLLAQVTDNYLDNKFGFRDKCMADNAGWILENTKVKKLIVWAHNGHLSKAKLFNNVPSLGTHLYQKYNSRYFTVATSFNEGTVRIAVEKKGGITWENQFYPAVTSTNNCEFYFKQCKYPNFIIDISALNGDPVLTPFFAKPMVMRMVGATGGLIWTKFSILEHFDMIVFLNSTHAN